MQIPLHTSMSTESGLVTVRYSRRVPNPDKIP
jgi:hypothetical protein